MHPVCEIWNLPNFHNIHFLSNRQQQKKYILSISAYTYMNSTDLFFYLFVATVTDLDFTSADLLGKVDVLHVAQKGGRVAE
jgi:hypothetical protein